MSVPQLRFDGFDGEWKDVSLGKLGDFAKGMALSKADISEEGDPCILYGELYTKYGPVINHVYSRTNSEQSKRVFGTKNDVLIPSSGETAIDIACASALEAENVLLGGDLNIFKPKENVSGAFLSYQINGVRKFELSKLAQGASVVHLYSNSLENFKVRLPSYEEQQKIASFLKILGKKIEKQKEKIEELEHFKKGMMQRIFSQELRFKDEDGGEFGEWTSLQFGDVVEKLIGGGTPSRQVEEYYGGSIPWVTVKDLKTNKYVTTAIEYITELGLEKSNSKIVDPGDLIIPTRMAVGRVLIATEKVAINQDLKGCKLKAEYDTEFIYYLYFSKSVSIEKLASGSTVTGINIDQLMKIRIQVPILEEQKKIADYLGKLDKKIGKEKEKLMVLEEQKKGLMQGMFV